MVSRLAIVEVPPHTPCKATDVRGRIVSVQVAPDSGYAFTLQVMVTNEEGNYYIEPSGADYCCYSVDPWYLPPDP
jgi:hypothetical protein